MTDEHDSHELLDAEMTKLGPFGFWRWKYLVTVRDVGHLAGPSEFSISVLRKKGGHWHSVDGGKVTLYGDGEEGKLINDRTSPSEDEQERLIELAKYFP